MKRKHHGLSRLLLCALIGVALAYAIPGHSPASAVPAPAQVATGFHEVALQGFGDFQNSWPWSGAWFKGRLYIGTARNIGCAQAVGQTYPPTDTQVTCPPLLHNLPPTLGAQIWSVDPTSAPVLTQSNWTMNYSSPITVPMTIDGTATTGPRDYGYRGMSVFANLFDRPALYVSGMGMSGIAPPTQALPPSLLSSTDGVNFQAVPSAPGTTMGDINALTSTFGLLSGMRDQASFEGVFYVTITNGQGDGTIFASATPKLGDNTFKQITPPNMAVWSLQPFNHHLYFGVASTAGYSVWRTDCRRPPRGQPYCPPSAFTEVIPPGADVPNNQSESVTSMQVFTDPDGVKHLYIGAAANVGANPGPAELTRINTDDSWDVIMGMTRTVNGQEMDPLSGLGPGFGWPFNMHMWRMAVYKHVLYVGTYDASTSALKGTPKQHQYQSLLGFDLFASVDGMHFIPVTLNGFGDMYDEGVRALVSTPDGLFVGAANHWYGLRIFQGSVPSSALRLTPWSVQAAPLPAGRIALAWAAPPRAVLYHIYRSEARRERVRFPLSMDTTTLLPRRYTTRAYWLPGGFREIATTRAPVFVDRGAPSAHVIYYVVAQDAHGDTSAPSPLAAMPLLAPMPTFGRVETLLTQLESRGAITRPHAMMLWRVIQGARQRLGGGDVTASRAALQAAGRLVLSSARSATARRYAEEVSYALTDLSTRESLVGAHLFSAAQLEGAHLLNAAQLEGAHPSSAAQLMRAPGVSMPWRARA